jgi:acyl carrier protein
MAFSHDTLRAYLEEKLGLDTSEVENDTLLFSTGLLDSFSMVELLMFIETEGGFRLSPNEVNLDNLDSIDRIARLVEERSCPSE